MTYNLLNYGATQGIDEDRRRDELHARVRELGPDVLALQEIWADGEDKTEKAAASVREFADATGLECVLPGGGTSVAIGNLPFHTALLWNPGIEVDNWYACSGTQLWHSLGKVDLRIDSKVIAHASFHATPFGRHRRADENERVVSIMTRPDNRPPGLIGGDFNCLHADRVYVPAWRDADVGGDEKWVYYDPDPFPNTLWHSDFIHQCEWSYDKQGRRRWRGSREAGEVLVAGELADVAAHLQAPWHRTCGYWPGGDPYPDRRVDAIKATFDMLSSVQGHHVEDTEATISVSDHLPVVVEYDPAAL